MGTWPGASHGAGNSPLERWELPCTAWAQLGSGALGFWSTGTGCALELSG